MSAEAASSRSLISPFEQIQLARDIIRTEGETLVKLAERIGEDFCRATKLLLTCQGSIIVSGMGKAGLVGQKVAATMASTGTRSHFLHPGEAVHGDLGRVHSSDVVLLLSQSGETDEILRLLPSLSEIDVSVIAITGSPESSLGRHADITLDLGSLREAGDLGLAPSTSTTAMLALGDALSLVTSQMREFCAEDFARFHPGGSLGRQLARVDDIMRPLAVCRVAHLNNTVRNVLIASERPGRRSGAILLMDDFDRLAGIFTDSDLARLLENQQDGALDRSISEVMTVQPTTIQSGSRVKEAIQLLAQRKLSEIPVVDDRQSPLGLIDITDVVGVQPSSSSKQNALSESDTSVDNDSQDISTIQFPDTE